MLINILLSNVADVSGYTPGGNFSRFTPDSKYYKVFDTDQIDWLSFRKTTQDGGIPVTTFNYTENGVSLPYSTFISQGSIAKAAGATTPGIASYDPNIYITSNVNLGHNINISSQGAGPWSNSFASYNPTLNGQGVSIVPASWSIDIIQPLAGVSITLGTLGGANTPTAVSAPFSWVTGTTTGLFIFQVNATSVDGLTTNQVFIWNIFNQ